MSISLRMIRSTTRRVRIAILVTVAAVAIFICVRYIVNTNRMNQTYINLDKWLDKNTTKCNGNFIGYAHEFSVLHYAQIDKTKRVFAIPCEGPLPRYDFLFGKEGTVLNLWMKTLRTYPYSDIETKKSFASATATFTIMRIEAHNLYHTMCEWFNVFLIAKLLNINASNVNVIFMDDRPRGLMDDTWDILFGEVTRYSNLPDNVVLKDVIWNVIGYESPLNFHNLREVKYVEDFYRFFLQSFGIREVKKLDCRKLKITIIWRRDYMSHPERNEIGGLIHRKFLNEKEILQIVNTMFKGHEIRDVVLETMTMKEQVDLLSSTDLLFGMHGAGMAHAMFLPKHAAVFETFPNYWGFPLHFRAFSRWRGIKYLGWQNTDPVNEYPNYYTRIPASVISSNLETLKHYLCPGES